MFDVDAGGVVVKWEPELHSPCSAVARLALLVEQRSRWSGRDALVREFLAVVQSVEKEENAVKLRSARLLAWARTQDVSEARYPSWTAFLKEFSPWRGSRTRDYVRLVESRLEVIKEAASTGEIDLTIATRAPRELGPDANRDAQLAWLAEATFRALPKRHRAFMVVLTGAQMRHVLQARRLAATLIGWDAPAAQIDDFIIDCHERKLTGAQILERARAAPPRPPRLDDNVPEWKDDPSVSLLGPWEEPTDIHDAVSKLRAVERSLEKRRLVLGMAYFLIRRDALWISVPGCSSLGELCLAHLGISQRTFQRYAREGLTFLERPELRKAVEECRLTLDRATFAADHRKGDLSLESWLDLVRRLGRAELERAQEGTTDRVADRYAPVLDLACEIEAIARTVKGGDMCETAEGSALAGEGPPEHRPTEIASALLAAAKASAIGGTAGGIASHLLAVRAAGPIQIALRGADDANRRSGSSGPDHIFAPPKLLAAADYLLSVVSLPRESGARKVVAHDGWICQNPRCRRRTLRVHHHHVVERRHGGTDDPWNIVTLCPACHLRGIHSKRLSVMRIGDWLIWTWPPGGRTGPRSRLAAGTALMHSPVSARARCA